MRLIKKAGIWKRFKDNGILEGEVLYKKTTMEVFPIIVPFCNKLKSINFYLVRYKDSLILIDAGMDTEDCWRSLQKILEENHYKLIDISAILLTHHHTDHIGLVNRIVCANPIPVYAHPRAIPILKRDSEYMKRRKEFFRNLYRQMGCGKFGDRQVVDLHNPILLTEDKKIECDIKVAQDLFFDFDILDIPGHAPDQIAFYNRNCKWLFSGDLLIAHMASNAFIEPNLDGVRTNSLIQQKRSLEKCLSLDVEVIFSGHGDILQNPVDIIKERIIELDKKANIYLDIIKSGISTGHDIARFRFNERYEKQFFNIISEIIGYLDYLELQGEIHKEMENGIWQYY
ncbi:MBL fold metallo-hydrolase [Peribacillus sp. SI8-4]|uniref:MBL fold metallo-hydrolase n=1 Tax=Peribacillus sp. SI8-4 TaxID=3048009 RepID=UPI0025557150|nr:MBL fold metallo-hydrolase [Peribacillus sp. SI8-4]